MMEEIKEKEAKGLKDLHLDYKVVTAQCARPNMTAMHSVAAN